MKLNEDNNRERYDFSGKSLSESLVLLRNLLTHIEGEVKRYTRFDRTEQLKKLSGLSRSRVFRLLGDKLNRIDEVESITGLSRSEIYRKMEDGEFPRPVRVGARAVRWWTSNVYTWMESCPEADDSPGDR